MTSYLPVQWSPYNYYDAAANDGGYLTGAGVIQQQQQQLPYIHNYVYDAQQVQQQQVEVLPPPKSKPQTQIDVLPESDGMFYGYDQAYYQKPYVQAYNNKPYKNKIYQQNGDFYLNNNTQAYGYADQYVTYGLHRSYSAPYDDFLNYQYVEQPNIYYNMPTVQPVQPPPVQQQQKLLRNQYYGKPQYYYEDLTNPQAPQPPIQPQAPLAQVPIYQTIPPKIYTRIQRSITDSSLKSLLAAKSFEELEFKGKLINPTNIKDPYVRFTYEKLLRELTDKQQAQTSQKEKQRLSNEHKSNDVQNIQWDQQNGAIPKTYRVHEKPLYGNVVQGAAKQQQTSSNTNQNQNQNKRNGKPVFIPPNLEKLLQPTLRGVPSNFTQLYNNDAVNVNVKETEQLQKPTQEPQHDAQAKSEFEALNEEVDKLEKKLKELKSIDGATESKTTSINESVQKAFSNLDESVPFQAASTGTTNDNDVNKQSEYDEHASEETTGSDGTRSDSTRTNLSDEEDDDDEDVDEAGNVAEEVRKIQTQPQTQHHSHQHQHQQQQRPPQYVYQYSSQYLNPQGHSYYSGHGHHQYQYQYNQDPYYLNEVDYFDVANLNYPQQQHQHHRRSHHQHHLQQAQQYRNSRHNFYNPNQAPMQYQFNSYLQQPPWANVRSPMHSQRGADYSQIHGMHPFNSDSEKHRRQNDYWKSNKNLKNYTDYANQKKDGKKVFGPSERTMQAEQTKPKPSEPKQSSKKRYKSDKASVAGSIFDVPLPSDNVSEYSEFVNNVFSKALDK